MTIARAYIRVSTQRQEMGISLDTQRAAIRLYATANGLTIVHEYVDVLSGSRDDRQRYQQMLSDLRPGEIVLVWRLDRIGRRKSELFRFFEWCKQHRIGLVSVTQPEMSNELARDIMSVLAAYESQQLAERVLPNMVARVEQGKWVSRIPLYYQMGPAGTLVPADNAHEAQQVWDMVLATGSIQIAAAAFGINTITLRATLKRRAYLGETAWNGITIPDTHPAIVRRETWEAVAALRESRQRDTRRETLDTALLTGFIYVEDSERRMYHYQRRAKTDPTLIRHYYVAPTDSHQPRWTVRADDAERVTVDALKTLSLTRAQVQEMRRALEDRARRDPDKRERVTLQRRIAALDAERMETNRMEAQRRITPYEADEMRGRQNVDRGALQARLQALPPMMERQAIPAALAPRLNLAVRIEGAYAAGNVRALRHLVEGYIARVEVYGGMATRHQWRQAERRIEIRWNRNSLMM